jgi:hypothetical protein
VWDIEATGVDEADCGADCDITLLAYPMKDQSKSSSDDSQLTTENAGEEVWTKRYGDYHVFQLEQGSYRYQIGRSHPLLEDCG